MTRTDGRRHLRVLLRQQFGAQWPMAYRTFWGVWRAMGFPEMDECDDTRVLSAMVTVVASMKKSTDFLSGATPPMTLACAN